MKNPESLSELTAELSWEWKLGKLRGNSFGSPLSCSKDFPSEEKSPKSFTSASHELCARDDCIHILINCKRMSAKRLTFCEIGKSCLQVLRKLKKLFRINHIRDFRMLILKQSPHYRTVCFIHMNSQFVLFSWNFQIAKCHTQQPAMD